MKSKLFITILISVFGAFQSFAQTYSIKFVLQDADNSDALPFATVSITPEGAKQASAYTLSDDKGNVIIEKIKPGKYTMKSELLGYKADSRQVEIKNANLVLPAVKLQPDVEQLQAAKVSAMGNPIIMKQDTIEFSATTFKSADNDVLEDLLKKIPGMEVSEDGSITHNGKSINKITIDGKTFFLDDPQIASKNIPAKAISKLKVVEKKSDQAQFTGIDDGEEETILDLSFHPGMMKGSFGNLMGGGGVDMPATDV
ncbi:MAG: carboxypeptidase-like regulatory domain-containing protein, partial [Bacteroidales bacterium]|nr:carboxypeptidase-like regulatory domain-containing protein [Bacteroidales bacterium]